MYLCNICQQQITAVKIVCNCHGSASPAPFPITAHALTWSHLSLIEHTCNHSPLPFISSLTSVTRRLVLRSQRCMDATRYTGHCLPVCPGSGPRLRKRKFTYSATVHPASKAFFVISPMLEALPELYWINHLVLASASLSPWPVRDRKPAPPKKEKIRTAPMEERARFISLACENPEPWEFATAFIPLALTSSLEDGVHKTLFRLGISYHRPVELPDTSNLNWEETVIQCLGDLQSRAGSPSSTPFSPLVPSSSALTERLPVPAPRQPPPVPTPHKCSQILPLVLPSSSSSPLVPSRTPEHPRESEPPERPRESASPERPRESAPPERPR